MLPTGNWERTADPLVEPVILAEMQRHLAGYNPDDDTDIQGLIVTAREAFEAETHLAIIDQTWELTLPDFMRCIPVPIHPVRSITSIQYFDSAGAEQTLDADTYRFERINGRTQIVNTLGNTFPSVETCRADAVKITFQAGIYSTTGDPATVDTDSGAGLRNLYPLAQRAIKILGDHMYRNRGVVAPVTLTDVPMAYQSLVDFCRMETA